MMELEQRFFCPLAGELLEEPVRAADGVTYERRAVEDWLEAGLGWLNPVGAGARLDDGDLEPDTDLAQAYQQWVEGSKAALPQVDWRDVAVDSQPAASMAGTTANAQWEGRPVALLRPHPSVTLPAAEAVAALERVGRHPSAVSLLASTTDSAGRLHLLLEQAPHGTLAELLAAAPASGLPAASARTIALQVCEGMQMLGAYGLIHRSLSAESVYVFGRGGDPGGWNVKVGGLGLLCVDEELEGAAAGALPAWLAPEAIQKGRWSDKSDVWAFGHVLWELHAGCGRRAAALLDAADGRSSGELPRPSGCPDEVFSVISTCWATSPRKRPTFGELHQKLVAAYAQVMWLGQQQTSGLGVVGDAPADPMKALEVMPSASPTTTATSAAQAKPRPPALPLDTVSDVLATGTYNPNLTDHISVLALTDTRVVVSFGSWGDIFRGAAAVGTLHRVGQCSAGTSSAPTLRFCPPCFFTEKVPHPVPALLARVSPETVLVLQQRSRVMLARVTDPAPDSEQGDDPGVAGLEFGEALSAPTGTKVSYWTSQIWVASAGLAAVLHLASGAPCVSLAHFDETRLAVDSWDEPLTSEGLPLGFEGWKKSVILSPTTFLLLYVAAPAGGDATSDSGARGRRGRRDEQELMAVVGAVDLKAGVVRFGPPTPVLVPRSGDDEEEEERPQVWDSAVAVLTESLALVFYAHSDERTGTVVAVSVDPYSLALDPHGWVDVQSHGVWEVAAAAIPGRSSAVLAFSDSPQGREDQWQTMAGPGVATLAHYSTANGRRLSLSGRTIYETSRVWKTRMTTLAPDVAAIALRNYSRRQYGEMVLLQLL
eukprot:jgi/Tetstr1/437587/TSEL_026258.t1